MEDSSDSDYSCTARDLDSARKKWSQNHPSVSVIDMRPGQRCPMQKDSCVAAGCGASKRERSPESHLALDVTRTKASNPRPPALKYGGYVSAITPPTDPGRLGKRGSGDSVEDRSDSSACTCTEDGEPLMSRVNLEDGKDSGHDATEHQHVCRSKADAYQQQDTLRCAGGARTGGDGKSSHAPGTANVEAVQVSGQGDVSPTAQGGVSSQDAKLVFSAQDLACFRTRFL